ncbi:hypothetical protein EVAR_12583_1 [Eumeta japonica]|uniref:Uncharacterized protein n=1 Tax=Eumeta variegata TaxID=151549 RepID=A0A4C1UEW0_EUMVA|nr:hypothetical protein EVAR_12583_1 [Eumeta japonica]
MERTLDVRSMVRQRTEKASWVVACQSSDDEQRQYAKSQVCTVLRRRVPPCTETSAAEPFLVHSQSSYDEQRQYAKSQSVPLFVKEFHRARKSAPLNRFIVHGQSSDDK